MDLTDLRAFETDTATVVPGFKLGWKDESASQKLLGAITKVFNPSYMTSYTTTLYPMVYFPSKAFYEADPARSFMTLAHERVHLLDTVDSPLGFRLRYLYPQILFLPLLLASVGAFFLIHWWAALGLVPALACLLPWPAPGRVHLEQRGYAMSMATCFWLTGDIPFARKESIRKQFLSMAYFKMSWSPSAIDKWISDTENAVRNGTLAANDPVYGDVLKFLQNRGKARV